jgi:hypothetical protein
MAANVPSRIRPAAVLAPLVFVVGCAVQVALAFGPSHVRSPAAVAGQAILIGIPVVIGCLLWARAPGTAVGPALSWVGAAPAGVFAIEGWGATAATAHPWPAAHVVAAIEPGVWVWNSGSVRYSMGALKWCRRGQLILALSSGPSVEFMVYRYSTSAGSPHRVPPSLSI